MARGRGSKNHPHKYRRINFGNFGDKVFACALPDCTHYMPKHLEEQLVGKRAICWECDEVFALDEDALKTDRPICLGCRTKAVREQMASLGITQ